MLSKNKLHYLSSLQNKKFREQFCEFLIEGDKIVKESLVQKKMEIKEVLALSSWVDQNINLLKNDLSFELTIISEKDLERISSLKTPNQVVARLSIKENPYNHEFALKGLSIFLDGIQDPGNAGTIVRTAEWYGIKQIIFSPDSVDRYNPKFIQACMGSIFRVSLLKYSFEEFKNLSKEIPWWGATLQGVNINGNVPELPGILVMGNESSGLRPELEITLDKKFKIPKHIDSVTESLNVSVAAGILMDKITSR
jgi:TrmH family RNA methyltransferase